MIRNLLLALAIGTIAAPIEFGLLVRGDVGDAFITDVRTRYLFYLVVAIPIIEELARYAVLAGFTRFAARRGWSRLQLRDFLTIGLILGAAELLAKLAQTPSLTTQAGWLDALSNVSSIPIQLALTVALPAISRWRLAWLIGLHILINLLAVFGSTFVLSYTRDVLVNTVAMLTAISALCSLIVHQALLRLKEEGGSSSSGVAAPATKASA